MINVNDKCGRCGVRHNKHYFCAFVMANTHAKKRLKRSEKIMRLASKGVV